MCEVLRQTVFLNSLSAVVLIVIRELFFTFNTFTFNLEIE